jgi:hypothetical protein
MIISSFLSRRSTKFPIVTEEPEPEPAFPVPNVVTSRTTPFPFVNGANDWQGRPQPVLNEAGETVIHWSEDLQHSPTFGVAYSYNSGFISADGLTVSNPNQYLDGSPIGGFPLQAQHPDADIVAEGNLFKCPNGDLIFLAIEFSQTSPAFNGRNVTYWQHRSVDGGKNWIPEFDWCVAAGFATPNKIMGGYNAKVIGGDIYVCCFEVDSGLTDTRMVLVKSSNNGVTWAQYSNIVEFDEAPSCSEADICDLGGGRWISILRTEVDLTAAYKKISTNSGLTWGPLINITDVLKGGIGQPKITKLSDGVLLLSGRNVKDTGSTYRFNRCAMWPSTDEFSTYTNAPKLVLDPFYAGSGDDVSATNIGDSGYARPIVKPDNSITLYGYWAPNGQVGPARIYQYKTTYTPDIIREIYYNREFPFSGTGVELQMNKDNVYTGTGSPVLGGEAIVARVHNEGSLGYVVWRCASPGQPEYWMDPLTGKGWLIFGGTSYVYETVTTSNSLFRAAYSMGGWVMPNDGIPATTQMLVRASSATTTSLDDRVQFFVDTAGKLTHDFGTNGTAVTAKAASAIWANGPVAVPTYVAATNDGTNIRLYSGVLVSGVPQVTLLTLDAGFPGSMAGQTMTNFSSTQMIHIGGRQTAATPTFDLGYSGKMRQVRIKTGTWSMADIANEMLN